MEAPLESVILCSEFLERLAIVVMNISHILIFLGGHEPERELNRFIDEWFLYRQIIYVPTCEAH